MHPVLPSPEQRYERRHPIGLFVGVFGHEQNILLVTHVQLKRVLDLCNDNAPFFITYILLHKRIDQKVIN